MIPWNYNTLRCESEKNKNMVRQSNFAHSRKLNLFKKLGVNSIESNLTSGKMKSFKIIKENGFKTYTHIRNSTLAFTRSCPVKRVSIRNKDILNGCSHLCTNVYELKMHMKWEAVQSIKNKNMEDNFSINEEVNKNFPELFVKGNVIMTKVYDIFKISDMTDIDTFIINDWEYSNEKDLLDEIDKIRDFRQSKIVQ